jgi:hypothetical protein
MSFEQRRSISIGASCAPIRLTTTLIAIGCAMSFTTSISPRAIERSMRPSKIA